MTGWEAAYPFPLAQVRTGRPALAYAELLPLLLLPLLYCASPPACVPPLYCSRPSIHPRPSTCPQVRSSLGQAGELATETAALLSMEQVQDDDQFTPEVCLGGWGGQVWVQGS